jgi:hypothetical protein
MARLRAGGWRAGRTLLSFSSAAERLLYSTAFSGSALIACAAAQHDNTH